MTETMAAGAISSRNLDNTRAAYLKETAENLSAATESKTKLLEFLCYGRQGAGREITGRDVLRLRMLAALVRKGFGF